MIYDWLYALLGLLPDWFWFGYLAVGVVAIVAGIWRGIRMSKDDSESN